MLHSTVSTMDFRSSAYGFVSIGDAGDLTTADIMAVAESIGWRMRSRIIAFGSVSAVICTEMMIIFLRCVMSRVVGGCTGHISTARGLQNLCFTAERWITY